jgi:hypothetical protein
MFTTGMPAASILFYMYATMLIAVPTGVKVFNWLATMWKGAISLEAPMLFALGFLFLFVVGGFTGLILAIQPIDVQFQDTYYVVAHFHYVMVAGTLFAFFGGAYYWLPKWTGHLYDEKLADWHFWLSFIFFNVAFFPMHFLGLAGMPADSGLRAAVHRLEHGVDRRRVRVRFVAARVPAGGRQMHTGRRAGARQAVGRRNDPRVDAAVAGAVPHVRNPAGRQVIRGAHCKSHRRERAASLRP